MSKWPKWLWVGLTARNFCRTYDKKSDNRKDLLSWVIDTFEDTPVINEVCGKINENIVEAWVRYIDDWVNDAAITFKMQADLWNNVMKELGYTEDYEKEN